MWARISKALAAILVAQAGYWFLVSPLLFSNAPWGSTFSVENLRVATIPEPTLEATARALPKSVEFGHGDCCGPGYRAFWFDLPLTHVPPDGLAFVSQFTADNVSVYFNGSLLRAEGRLELPDITYHNNLRPLIHIPAALAREGRNEFLVLAVRDAIPWFDAYRPLVGPYTALSHEIEGRRFMRYEYKLISLAVGAVLAALSVLVCLRSERRRFGAWMFLLLVAWALRNHYYVWMDPPFDGQLRLGYYFLITTAMPLAWINLANEWSGTPLRWLSRGSIAVFAMCLALITHALGWGGAEGYDRASDITNYFGIVLGAGAVARFAMQLLRFPDDRRWEAAIIVLCVSLAVVEFMQELLFDRTNAPMTTSLPVLFSAFAIAFVRDHMRLLRLTTDRQRVMFDMHDGIGGQLASLLVAVRRSALPQVELEERIVGIIDELRIVIDSLDSGEANLSTALGGLRSRLQPVLESAGIQLDWHNDVPVIQAELVPNAVVQTLRIVQEAVTNAIKHSQTSRVTISARPAGKPVGAIELRVRDFGIGIRPDVIPSHGSESMQRRAEAIGASITVQRVDPGTEILLVLPAAAA